MTAIQHNPPANSRTPSARELVAAKNAKAPMPQAASTAWCRLHPTIGPIAADTSTRLLPQQSLVVGSSLVRTAGSLHPTTIRRFQRVRNLSRSAPRRSSATSGSTVLVSRPTRMMGLLYSDDFVMPPRESLGDLDKTKWELGLNGQPADPWGHHMYLVLQDTATSELYTFDTASNTGRRAVGNLLRHYDRMQRTHPDELPVIRLRTGGFQHKDDRVGFVKTPVFVVCGRTPSDSAARPDKSTAAFLNDDVPFAPEWRG